MNIEDQNSQPKHKPIVLKAGVVPYQRTEGDKIKILLITARTVQKWIFPVGNVDPGETLEEAAKRECSEESGYVVDIEAKLKEMDLDKGKEIYRFAFIMARADPEKRSSYEIDRSQKWVTPSQLIQQIAEDFLPVAQAALAQLKV
jgi:8-oxo-dGTP pyrophosphatase MutT (NUDIX family)